MSEALNKLDEMMTRATPDARSNMRAVMSIWYAHQTMDEEHFLDFITIVVRLLRYENMLHLLEHLAEQSEKTGVNLERGIAFEANRLLEHHEQTERVYRNFLRASA